MGSKIVLWYVNLKTEMKELKQEIYRKPIFLETEGA